MFKVHELQTVFNKVELILNSRSLGFLYVDDLEETLTPSHLLYEWQLNLTNCSDFNNENAIHDVHKCM